MIIKLAIPPLPGIIIVPTGTEVLSHSPIGAGMSLEIDLADYDYEPFADPEAPEFEFLADVIRLAEDRTITVDRDVVCISKPGRLSLEKET